MAVEILWCTRPDCRVGFGRPTELPAICPACHQPTVWSTLLPAQDPRVPYELTEQDRTLFMKARGIAAERDDG